MGYRFLGSSFLVAVALVSGCVAAPAPPPTIVEVEGTVQLDGKPLNKVEVQFVPVSDNVRGYVARGVTDEQGRFKLTCKGKPGACAGENYVVVKESEIPRKLQGEKVQKELDSYRKSLGVRPPLRYGNAAESPLRATVTAEQKEYDFHLEKD